MTGVYNGKYKNKFFMLLKNDFLASSRVISFVYIAIALVFAGIAVCTFIQKASFFSEEMVEKATNIGFLFYLGAWLVSGLLVLITSFFVIYDFFKSLFGQQGYLSFTLPVSSYELLGSKVIVYGGWLLLSYVVWMTTYFMFMNYTMTAFSNEMNIAEMFLEMLGDMPVLDQFVALIVWFMAIFFMFLISIVFVSYFAISLAHIRIFQKFSLIASVPIVIGITIATIIICIYATKIFNVLVVFDNDMTLSIGVVPCNGFLIQMDGQYTGLQVTPLFVLAGLDVLMFFLTAIVMHKKVNLK